MAGWQDWQASSQVNCTKASWHSGGFRGMRGCGRTPLAPEKFWCYHSRRTRYAAVYTDKRTVNVGLNVMCFNLLRCSSRRRLTVTAARYLYLHQSSVRTCLSPHYTAHLLCFMGFCRPIVNMHRSVSRIHKGGLLPILFPSKLLPSISFLNSLPIIIPLEVIQLEPEGVRALGRNMLSGTFWAEKCFS